MIFSFWRNTFPLIPLCEAAAAEATATETAAAAYGSSSILFPLPVANGPCWNQDVIIGLEEKYIVRSTNRIESNTIGTETLTHPYTRSRYSKTNNKSKIVVSEVKRVNGNGNRGDIYVEEGVHQAECRRRRRRSSSSSNLQKKISIPNRFDSIRTGISIPIPNSGVFPTKKNKIKNNESPSACKIYIYILLVPVPHWNLMPSRVQRIHKTENQIPPLENRSAIWKPPPAHICEPVGIFPIVFRLFFRAACSPPPRSWISTAWAHATRPVDP